MRIKWWLIFTSVLGANLASGQVKRQFNVEDTPACESVKLYVKANSGNCYIKPSQNTDILNVFSNQDAESFSHNFYKEVKGKICEVRLDLEQVKAEGFSHTLSTRVFGASEKTNSDKYWKMYLTDNKPYRLELTYGVGNANVDLSGLSVKKLQINTGSADVNIGYNTLENRIDMDSFLVKVDLGSVKVRKMNLSRAHFVMADVGFGNMTLDFSGEPLVTNLVKGSVGAGNLVIILPDTNVPVLVKVRDSWLCSVSMPKNLQKIAENTFANQAYQAKSVQTPLTFDLDVSMGHIIFKEAHQ